MNQLSLGSLSFCRYNVPAAEAVELLSKTLYQSSPFEYAEKERSLEL